MSRTEKFIKNTASTALFQILSLFVGMVVPRLILDAYGSEVNGLVSSIKQFIDYFRLVEAGISGAVVFALYQPLAEENHQAINGILSATKETFIKTGVIFLLFLSFFSLVYPFLLGNTPISSLHITALVFVLGMDATTQYFIFSKYWVFLVAQQKNYVISLSSVAQLLTYWLFAVTMAKPWVDIVLFMGLCALTYLLRSLLLWLYCRKKYGYLRFQEAPNHVALEKRWDACQYQVFTAINTGLPVVLLTLLTRDLKLVSVYSVFSLIINGISGLLGIFSTVLPVTFGDMIARGERAELKLAHSKFEQFFYSLLSFVFSVTLVTIMPFIRVYTSGIEDNEYNLPVFGGLYVCSALFSMIALPQGMLVASAGHYKETKGFVATQCLINVLVSVVCIPVFGIYGVMIGALTASVFLCVVWFHYTPNRITGSVTKKSMARVRRIFLCLLMTCGPFFFVGYEGTFFIFTEYTPLHFLEWGIFASLVGVYGLLVLGFLCWWGER